MRRTRAMTLLLAGVAMQTVASDLAGDFGGAVRQFSAARHKLAQELSARLELPLPPQAEAFFRAAETGPWEAVSNAFDHVKLPYSWDTEVQGKLGSELRNELWAPVHEAMGIWEVWVGWKEDSALLALFHEPVLASMPTGSIYFGGTDYGRFVITTANALREPPPIFCITQNALADNTYMAHLRAFYGDRIWLPQEEDSGRPFEQYIEEVRTGERPANAAITFENGRVQVTGALGVMEINGILCKTIFEHNKETHEFFVEESYVLNWMYPYLEPHGLILKLNRQPLDELSEETVTRDREFWNRYVDRLENCPNFATNVEAQKAFSKLRSAVAGLYAYRKMYAEAEAAFRQALRIHRAAPEVNYRLAKMYEEQGKLAAALDVMTAFVAVAEPEDLDGAKRIERYFRFRMASDGDKPAW